MVSNIPRSSSRWSALRLAQRRGQSAPRTAGSSAPSLPEPAGGAARPGRPVRSAPRCAAAALWPPALTAGRRWRRRPARPPCVLWAPCCARTALTGPGPTARHDARRASGHDCVVLPGGLDPDPHRQRLPQSEGLELPLKSLHTPAAVWDRARGQRDVATRERVLGPWTSSRGGARARRPAVRLCPAELPSAPTSTVADALRTWIDRQRGCSRSSRLTSALGAQRAGGRTTSCAASTAAWSRRGRAPRWS